jgi:hypothetical protein
MQVWAIHYDDGKKHPLQPRGIKSGIVVAGFSHASCRVILAQFEKAVDLTKCQNGFIEDNNFHPVTYTCDHRTHYDNETD